MSLYLLLSLLSFLLPSQFEFLCCHNFIIYFFTIWVFEFGHNLIFQVLSQFVFWVLSQFEFLSFATIYFFLVFFCQFEFFFSFVNTKVVFLVFHNLDFLVFSQFEFSSFVAIWVFEFCHNLSFVTVFFFSLVIIWVY